MKKLHVFCGLALLLAALFLTGCADSGESAPQENMPAEKDHYYEVLEGEDGDVLYSVTDTDAVDKIDNLLGDVWENGDSVEEPSGTLYTYVYSQEKTLLAGQDPEEPREFQELFRVAVREDSDTITIQLMDKALSGVKELLPQIDVGDILTFSTALPKESVESLRDPAQLSPADA